jgi:hypothetical protein
MAHYFRGGADGFVFSERDGICEARIAANADRTVELFLALAEHLPPAVQVEITDARRGETWSGEDLALVDARDAIARLKPLLSTSAGLEFTVFGSDDQLTLTPNVEVYIYARTDRWLYLLQGKGLRRLRRLRPRSWRLTHEEFGEAPEVGPALQLAAERLGLTVVRPDQSVSDGDNGRKDRK